MKGLVIFSAFIALCFAVDVSSEANLRAALSNVPADGQINIQYPFNVQNQISYTSLNDETITFTGQVSYPIQSLVSTGPLFTLGGTNLDLTFTGISLRDISDSGSCLIDFTGKKLTIDSGMYLGLSNTVQVPIIKTTNAAVIIGSAGTPTFNAYRVFDITGGSLEFIRGIFTYTSSSTRGTQIKATNADVNIGYEHVGFNLEIGSLTFVQQSSAVVLQSCKTVLIQQVTFQYLQTGQTDTLIYLTPALVVYASASTALTIKKCTFSSNTYRGQEFASGAVFVQFPRVAPAGSTPSVLIQDTDFKTNTGTSSGAITFINKGVKTITFTNVEFTGNTFTANYPGKASGIFATDDLNDQLGTKQFTDCYGDYETTPYGNAVPFYQSLEGRTILPYLKDNIKTVYVQTSGTGGNTGIYGSFNDAYGALTGTKGKIILNGGTFIIPSSASVVDFSDPIAITITPQGDKPTIYNQKTDTSTYTFTVSSTLTMSKFNIANGNSTKTHDQDTSQFFKVNQNGILKIKDIQFSTNLVATGSPPPRTGRFIYVESGSLYVDSCSFSGQGFADNYAAVQIIDPVTIEIKGSTFDGNTANSTGGAAGLIITRIDVSSQVTITGNEFKNNGPYSSGTVFVGAILVEIIAVTTQIIKFQGNTFTNNVGTSAGAAYIYYSGTLQASQLTLAGSTFSGNVIDIKTSSTVDTSDLFGSLGVYSRPLEVNSASTLDQTQSVTLNYQTLNQVAYQFKNIQAAESFSQRISGWYSNQITIVGIVQDIPASLINDDFTLKGKQPETGITNLGTVQITSDNYKLAFTGSSYLRWLDLVRTTASTATNLVTVTSGSLTVDGCLFSDLRASTDIDLTFILVSSSYTANIQNSIFNGAKFGTDGAAISKSAGTLSIVKCKFNGISTQTGPFLRLSGTGINNIRSSVFSGAATSAVVISTTSTSNFYYNVFTGITKGPAISIDTSGSFTVQVTSNEFSNNGDIVSSSAGAIGITSTNTGGTLTASNNLFINNKGTNAGAIYSATTNLPTFYIQYNFFSGNVGGSNGAKDIYITSLSTYAINNNIRRGGSADDARYGSALDTILGAYLSKQSYTYRSEVHVRPIGVDGIGDVSIDEGDGTGAIDNPLKTLDYAVNQRSTSGELNVVLYRQTYTITIPLLILDDTVTISDTDECSSPYLTSGKSTISVATGIYNAFSIKSGSLILNAINVDFIVGGQSPYSLIFISGAGSFEANGASITSYSQNIQLIQSTQAINSFKLTNIVHAPTSNTYSTYPLIDLTLNSSSTFEISDSTFNTQGRLRYATIKVDSKPAVFSFNHVTFNSLGTDTIFASVVQIQGAKIIPEDVFDHCYVSDPSDYVPLLQIPGESYKGEYDNVLIRSTLKEEHGKIEQLYYLQSIYEKITYVGSRYVFQRDTDDQLYVRQGGHLTVRGVTFIQQPRGSSVLSTSSGDAVIVLEGVGFLVATQEQIATGLGFLHSSDLREDLASINKKKQKINIDYYLESLQKTSHSQILTQPFVKIYSGYSLTLSSIRFGDWIVSGQDPDYYDYIPLIRVSGAIQHALIENIQVSRVGRQYGGPRIIDLNLRPSGEAVFRNVTIDGRGWVHNTEQPNAYQFTDYVTHGKAGKCQTVLTEFEKTPTEPEVKLDIDIPYDFNWELPAVSVTGGKLRISDTTFIGLGVDGALLLDGVEADLANSTRFEENDVYSAAKAEGRKKLIPSEIESVSDEEDSDEEYDEKDRRIRELRRYPDYIKNVFATGKTTLRAWNVSFIGEKLAKKKTAYKAGYPLWIQHEREVQLVGEVGQSNNAFGVPDIKYVKSAYVDGADKDLGNGKIEKTVETEIRTKGLLIPGVEWFLELKNKKDPEENPRIYHYSLLHFYSQGWNELSREKLLGWYISEDENLLKDEKKSTSNSYYESQFGSKVLIRWVSQSVILLRFAHIEPKPEEKANADEAPADPDADRYIKDWQFRLGAEKRADQQALEPDPDVKWTNLKKIPFPVWAIVLIVVLVVLLIAAIIVAIILFFVCRKQKVGNSVSVEMNSDK